MARTKIIARARSKKIKYLSSWDKLGRCPLLAKLSLQTDLERVAKELGADLFGVADLTIAQDFVCKQGGEYLRKFSRAVSIGIRLLDAVVDELFRHEDPAVIYTYSALYDSVNSRLDDVGLLLAKRMRLGKNLAPVGSVNLQTEKH